jgi:actin related protein 2/3 complex subunit 4
MSHYYAYLKTVRSALTAAMCLQNFASQDVERHNKPEVEVRTNPELLLNPVVIARNEQEKVLIEGSINSVRISVRVRKSDELDQLIAHKFMRFLMQRAESFTVLRRKPIAGYDLSFLVTNVHTEMMHKHKIVDFIIQFISDIDAELANMKFVISCRANAAANTYLRSFI